MTLICPVGGEEWPTDSYKSVIDLHADPLQYRNVHFRCPASHSFTLRKAVSSGMLTKEQGEKVFELAKKEVVRFRDTFAAGKDWKTDE